MKAFKSVLAVVCLGLLAAGPAVAHQPRTHVGLVIGAPVFDPWYRPAPWYPPTVIVTQPAPPPPPPVYIEQHEASVAPESYWYFCATAQGYYPYVRECPEPWQRILPHPAK